MKIGYKNKRALIAAGFMVLVLNVVNCSKPDKENFENVTGVKIFPSKDNECKSGSGAVDVSVAGEPTIERGWGRYQSEVYLTAKSYPLQIQAEKLENCEALRVTQKIYNSSQPVGFGLRQCSIASSADYDQMSPNQDESAIESSVKSGSSTNTQEAGVDEADQFKIGNNYIYAIDTKNRLQIVSRGNLEVEQIISLEGQTKLFVNADRLMVLSSGSEGITVKLYDTGVGKDHKELSSRNFEGALVTSRMIGNRLFLIVKNEISQISDNQNEVNGITCSEIYRMGEGVEGEQLLSAISLNTESTDDPIERKDFLGYGNEIYMTEKSIYVLQKAYINYEEKSSTVEWNTSGATLVAKIKIDPDTGELSEPKSGIIDGRYEDRWAFKELTSVNSETNETEYLLAAATTTGSLGSDSENHLWIFEEKENGLESASGIHGIAPEEDIRSVRYVGNTAYIVTFKTTDPLFAIDVEDPRKPRMLGELKIPGFSRYMHPLDEGRLLGVGYNAFDKGSIAVMGGIQVSLFDTTDPTEMSRIDNHLLGDLGSTSDVTTDHRAFFYDSTSGLVGIPVVSVVTPNHEEHGWGSELEFSGALMYRFENSSLTEVGRLSHKEMLPDNCFSSMAQGQWYDYATASWDINRIFSLGDKLITMSRFGLQFHSKTDPELVINQVVFGDNDCVWSGMPF